jgi:hypothetical protein
MTGSRTLQAQLHQRNFNLTLTGWLTGWLWRYESF